MASGVLRTVPYGDLLTASAERLGLALAQGDLAAALAAEADWISEVLPVSREQWLERVTSLMEMPLALPRTLPQVLGRYQARVTELLHTVETASGVREQGDILELAAGVPRAIAHADHPEELET